MVSALRPPIPEEKSLIGIGEACEVIQKAKPTIYALVRKGILRARHILSPVDKQHSHSRLIMKYLTCLFTINNCLRFNFIGA